MNFVIKISKPGFDVLTAQNKDLSFSSELATHSIYQVLNVSNQPGSSQIIINHNLGYIPKVWVYFVDPNSSNSYRRVPFDDGSVVIDYYITTSKIEIYCNDFYNSNRVFNITVIIFNRSV